jgi:hypothetical protein
MKPCQVYALCLGGRLLIDDLCDTLPRNMAPSTRKCSERKWIERGKEGDPVEVENSILTDLDKVIASAKDGILGMRLRPIARPPDGFIVADSDGKEVSRWVEPKPPNA